MSETTLLVKPRPQVQILGQRGECALSILFPSLSIPRCVWISSLGPPGADMALAFQEFIIYLQYEMHRDHTVQGGTCKGHASKVCGIDAKTSLQGKWEREKHLDRVLKNELEGTKRRELRDTHRPPSLPTSFTCNQACWARKSRYSSAKASTVLDKQLRGVSYQQNT